VRNRSPMRRDQGHRRRTAAGELAGDGGGRNGRGWVRQTRRQSEASRGCQSGERDPDGREGYHVDAAGGVSVAWTPHQK
jgi:hypothetical protein